MVDPTDVLWFNVLTTQWKYCPVHDMKTNAGVDL